MHRLNWTDYDGKDQEYHVTRLNPALKSFMPPHSHNYAELIFVDQGWCIHKVNSRNLLLLPGSLMFLRPKIDTHSFHAHSKGVSIFRIAIKEESIDFVCNRYFTTLSDLWGSNDKLPRIYSLNDVQCLWMGRAFRKLTREERNKLQIEKFLINLLDELKNYETVKDICKPKDDWLVEAYEWLQNPTNFASNLTELGVHVGKSIEHITRTMRKKFNKTPIDLFSEARFNYACEQLAFTRKNILDIADECGFNGISRFYSLFSKYSEKSPAAYRREKQLVSE